MIGFWNYKRVGGVGALEKGSGAEGGAGGIVQDLSPIRGSMYQYSRYLRPEATKQEPVALRPKYVVYGYMDPLFVGIFFVDNGIPSCRPCPPPPPLPKRRALVKDRATKGGL